MNKWTENLSESVERRLCNCCTKRSDLAELVNAKWLSLQENGKDKQGFTKEDALIEILELLDCNSQAFDLAKDEYEDLCR